MTFRPSHEAWVRTTGIGLAVIVAAAVMTSGVTRIALESALMFGAWALAFAMVESATYSVRAAVGPSSVALLGTLAGAAATATIAFVAPSLAISRAGLAIAAGAVLAVTLAWAAATRRLTMLKRRVLIVGVTASSRELLETLAQEPRQEFEIIGIVGQETTVDAVAGVPVVGEVGNLESIVRLAKPDLVLLGVERGRPDVFAHLAAVAGLGFQVVGLPEFHEHAFGRLPVRHITDAWFMSILHVYQRPYRASVKRTFDLVVSLAALLLTAPLFPLIALLVKATSPGPVLYRQQRLGEGGKVFNIVKFRTMRADAERGEAVWAEVADPRVTTVGRVLRDSRLDELPQMWNVLRGEMSIVGPRPERPDFLNALEAAVPFWSRRHLLKPGVTGWAQVRAGYASDHDAMETKLAHDLWYLRHQRLIVDFMICMRTLPRLLAKSGR